MLNVYMHPSQLLLQVQQMYPLSTLIHAAVDAKQMSYHSCLLGVGRLEGVSHAGEALSELVLQPALDVQRPLTLRLLLSHWSSRPRAAAHAQAS